MKAYHRRLPNIMFVLCVICLTAVPAWASTNPPAIAPTTELDLSLSRLASPILLTANTTEASSPLYAQSETDEPVDVYGFERKSPRRAFLQSFLIPGWGQWYNGNRWKPFLFLGLEAAGWYGVANFHSKGNDKEDVYRAFADEHWDGERYQEGLFEVFYSHSICTTGVPDRDEYLDVNQYCYTDRTSHYKGSTFSHHAFFKDEEGTKVERDERYENIGKYDQFNFGWDDYPGVGEEGFPEGLPNADVQNFNHDDSAKYAYRSPHRITYLGMRDEANQEFKKASTVLVLTFGNHLISAVEAAISAKRHNRAQDQFGSVHTQVQMVRAPSGRDLMTRMTVTYRFK